MIDPLTELLNNPPEDLIKRICVEYGLSESDLEDDGMSLYGDLGIFNILPVGKTLSTQEGQWWLNVLRHVPSDSDRQVLIDWDSFDLTDDIKVTVVLIMYVGAECWYDRGGSTFVFRGEPSDD